MKFWVYTLHWLLRALVGLALLLCLSGWTFPSAASDQNEAFVRVIHASPDVGIVDVFVDGQKLLSSFQFATVTEYVPLPAGSHNVQIALLGKGINAAMLSQTIQVQANTTYTIAVLGTKATGFSFTMFTDNDVLSGDRTKLRVYHLSPGTGTATIDEGSQMLIQGLAYTQGSDYLSLPAGSHTFSLNVTPQHTSETFTATLKPWTVTSVFAIGQLQGSQRFQFVTAQVQGVPQMPSTGSDPNAPISTAPKETSLAFWPASLLILGIIAIAAWFYRRSSVLLRQKNS